MAKILLIGSLSLGFIILSILLLASLDSLAYNTVGINYSSYFKSIENSTYESGFHFIGLGHDFIPYELKVQTMEFSRSSSATLPPIVCRTKDGLKLQLEISFQYRVLKNTIYEIYTTFGDEMKSILLRVAIDSISDTSTNYSSYDFFTTREEIGYKMKNDLDMRLKSDLYSEVVFFQLRSIDLPNDYEDAIQKTEVTKQGILQAQAARNKNKVVQATYVESAQIGKNITINQAYGKGDALQLRTNATAGTFLNITQSQAQAYQNMKENLTFSNADLIQYL